MSILPHYFRAQGILSTRWCSRTTNTCVSGKSRTRCCCPQPVLCGNALSWLPRSFEKVKILSEPERCSNVYADITKTLVKINREVIAPQRRKQNSKLSQNSSFTEFIWALRGLRTQDSKILVFSTPISRGKISLNYTLKTGSFHKALPMLTKKTICFLC